MLRRTAARACRRGGCGGDMEEGLKLVSCEEGLRRTERRLAALPPGRVSKLAAPPTEEGLAVSDVRRPWEVMVTHHHALARAAS